MRSDRLVLAFGLGLAALTSLACGDAKSGANPDGASSDGATCEGQRISCALGGPSGSGVACGGLGIAGTCVGGEWTCPKGMVDMRHCTCGEPGLSCSPQVCTETGPICLDAGADAGAGAGRDCDAPPAECRGELAEVGESCPAMFDGAPGNVPACARVGVQQVWTCGDVIALGLGAGAFSVDCYYGSSSHLLIGAMAVNDTHTLCGYSFTRSAGDVPAAACRFPVSTPSLYRVCGGADSGSN